MPGLSKAIGEPRTSSGTKVVLPMSLFLFQKPFVGEGCCFTGKAGFHWELVAWEPAHNSGVKR